uniref:Helicase-associated domain-containing protein n=1 Tax=Eutreptiella gymnastica TaxID=73025 RepID=A0A7S4G3U1_9EUGL
MATAVALVVAVGPGFGVPTPSTLSQATPTVRRHGMLSVGRAAAKHRSGAGACGDPWDATADAASTSGIPRGNIDWEVSERHTHVRDDARHSLMSGGLIVVGFLAAVLSVCLRSHWHVAAPIAVMSTGGKRSGNGRRWEKVKRALETYQLLHDDLYVRRGFVVPVHPDWPEDLWGMKLGFAVYNIRNNGTYSTHRAELEGMGFDFDS